MTKIIVKCAKTWPSLLISSDFWGRPNGCMGRTRNQSGQTSLTAHRLARRGLTRPWHMLLEALVRSANFSAAARTTAISGATHRARFTHVSGVVLT